MSFEAFQKIPRLSRDCVISEKIDGTNAQILIWHPSEFTVEDAPPGLIYLPERDMWLSAGSRNRYLTLEKDNYGFAKWVAQNAELLSRLGYGRHFGKWWGSGIQRGYGLKEKRFSLFNVGVWTPEEIEERGLTGLVYGVPVLRRYTFSTTLVEEAIRDLISLGSAAAPGFMDPEGVVIFHTASGQLFKKTIKNDEKPKGSREDA